MVPIESEMNTGFNRQLTAKGSHRKIRLSRFLRLGPDTIRILLEGAAMAKNILAFIGLWMVIAKTQQLIAKHRT